MTPLGQILALMDDTHQFMVETSARLLRLPSFLQTRRVGSGAELAERLDVDPRTVRRDVGRAPLEMIVESASPTAGRLERIDDPTCPVLAGGNDLERLELYIGLEGVDFEVLDLP